MDLIKEMKWFWIKGLNFPFPWNTLNASNHDPCMYSTAGKKAQGMGMSMAGGFQKSASTPPLFFSYEKNTKSTGSLR